MGIAPESVDVRIPGYYISVRMSLFCKKMKRAMIGYYRIGSQQVESFGGKHNAGYKRDEGPSGNGAVYESY